MSLFGNLEDLPLPYLLETIARNRITGKVVLRRRDGQGLIVCREGKIIYAASNSVRETIGNILMLRGLINASTLTEALERQGRSRREQRLGSILLEMGAIEEDALRLVIREQVEKVLLELCQWKSGFMKFEAIDIEECGEIAVDATDFLIEEGLPTEGMILDVMREIGRQSSDHLERELQAALGGLMRVEGEGEAARVKPPSALGSLKSVMSEIRAPAFTGEVTLGILRFASGLVSRGALFLHTSGNITGMGQFGIEEGSGNSRVRRIKVPAEEPSVFLEVIETKETYRGPLEDRYWNAELVRQLGGQWPREVAVIPMVVADRTALLFYGDNLPHDAELPGLEELELLMIQAGLAIEKRLLEEKLKALKEQSVGEMAPLQVLAPSEGPERPAAEQEPPLRRSEGWPRKISGV